MLARTLMVSALLLLGCGPTVVARPTPAQLNRTAMVFVRVFGEGRAPAIAQPVVYRLCVDFARGTVVDVLDPETRQSVDDQLANVLRGWKWRVLSSATLKSGVKCWRERFETVAGADGIAGLRATPAEPLRMLRLFDDALGAVGEVRDEDEKSVAVMDLFESWGLVYVLLAPRLDARALPAPAPSDVRGSVGTATVNPGPHLPAMVRRRFAGSELTTAYKMCVGGDGRVQRLVAEVPIDGAAEQIAGTLWQWKFPTQPEPVCTLLRFDYRISGL